MVVSLVFVGFQLFFDRQVALGAQYHERSSTGIANFQMQFESDAWVNTRARLLENGPKPSWWNEDIDRHMEKHQFTMVEMVRESLSHRMTLARMNNNYIQHTLGLLSEDVWNRNVSVIQQMARDDKLYLALGLNTKALEPELTEIFQRIASE